MVHKYLNNFWKVGVASKWVKPCLQNFLCFLSILIGIISKKFGGHSFNYSFDHMAFLWQGIGGHKYVCHQYCTLVFKTRRSLWGHVWCLKKNFLSIFKGICMSFSLELILFYFKSPSDLKITSKNRWNTYGPPCNNDIVWLACILWQLRVWEKAILLY